MATIPKFKSGKKGKKQEKEVEGVDELPDEVMKMLG
jgi:hypothetical protein